MIFQSSYKNFNSVTIETTEKTHKHSGKIYELMLQPKIGDPVIHFYLKYDVRYLDEFSFVSKSYFY